MIDKLKDTHQDQKRSTHDEIKAVENNTRKGKKPSHWIDWTSAVEWPSSSNDGEEEEEDNDEEEEDNDDEEEDNDDEEEGDGEEYDNENDEEDK